mmetsp:Transcript_33363/g.51164  ORF Transcript_33363/g.51164 Transcript_33363/m.51164 type:complete len:129 (-) Transcript_33363:355-741(-)
MLEQPKEFDFKMAQSMMRSQAMVAKLDDDAVNKSLDIEVKDEEMGKSANSDIILVEDEDKEFQDFPNKDDSPKIIEEQPDELACKECPSNPEHLIEEIVPSKDLTIDFMAMKIDDPSKPTSLQPQQPQ